jgi:rubredoxin
MSKYKCKKCGYTYNPEKGDSDTGVDPGTDFNDVADEWLCPRCKATKQAFKKLLG